MVVVVRETVMAAAMTGTTAVAAAMKTTAVGGPAQVQSHKKNLPPFISPKKLAIRSPIFILVHLACFSFFFWALPPCQK